MKEPLVSSEWLIENFKNPDIIILDTSQQKNISGLKTKFENIRIVGSRYFDIDNVFSDKENKLPHMLPKPKVFEEECRKLGLNINSKIIVYDNMGIYSSPRVWWMFKAMGHNDIAVLDGGLPDWMEKGFDIEQIEVKQYGYGNFEAEYNPELVKSADDIINNLKSNSAIVIDARSKGRFNGQTPEPREGVRGGNVPNSLNIPYTEILNGFKFKTKEELLEVFDNLDIDDRPLIFSCGSGITSCIVFLASELVLDNKNSIYDGSWTEWGQL